VYLEFKRRLVGLDIASATAGTSTQMLYRIDLPTMTLAFKNNHHAATTLPEGSVVDVIGPHTDDRFVVVKSSGEELLVFATDMSERGRPIKESRTATSRPADENTAKTSKISGKSGQCERSKAAAP
jgi:hypothetical protein